MSRPFHFTSPSIYCVCIYTPLALPVRDGTRTDAKHLALASYAALKIVKSANNYTEAAQDEIKMLRAVRKHDGTGAGSGYVVQLYDDFVVRFTGTYIGFDLCVCEREYVCVCVCVCVCVYVRSRVV